MRVWLGEEYFEFDEDIPPLGIAPDLARRYLHRQFELYSVYRQACFEICRDPLSFQRWKQVAHMPMLHAEAGQELGPVVEDWDFPGLNRIYVSFRGSTPVSLHTTPPEGDWALYAYKSTPLMVAFPPLEVRGHLPHDVLVSGVYVSSDVRVRVGRESYRFPLPDSL